MNRIPDEVLAAQRAASDPKVSAWVAANAGSGKTHVLAQRVIRLMLDGTDPAKILCLTFTKAAAANMANRVFDTLGAWTALDDAALGAAIEDLEGRRPDAVRRTRARRLFAEALECPGGLKVQTIHAFCTRLLHQFPFEAGVAARFEVLEERAQSEMIDRLRLGVLLEAAAVPESRLGRALAIATTIAADRTFSEVVDEAIACGGELKAWIAHAGGLDAAFADLSRVLGIAPEDDIEAIDAELLSGALLRDWRALAETLARGQKTDQEQATRLAAAATLSGAAALEAYRQVFLTGQGAPRKRLVTSAIEKIDPALAERMSAEQARLCALTARRRAVATRDRTAALVTIAATVLDRYGAEKTRRGLLDYDDLIDKTRAMLDRVDAAWVHYKLDLGIDHVLIDEAQDTSPEQWEVVARLTAEFTAGAGARGTLTRSIFAVGDEKQSIFSFQGAAPRKFSEMRDHFARRFAAARLGWTHVRFQRSFRSTPDVLGAVDAVFRRPEAHAGLSADPVPTVHEAVRETAPGLVELWPLIEPEDQPEAAAWDAPFDVVSEVSPRVRLARRIAATVKALIARRARVGDGEKRRPLRPGDVLVLVRQRGALFEAVIRALKDAGIAVAGADRLVLTEHIAVMDLIALADALLLPEDDLALATVLKSPLFGLDDDALLALAWQRPGSLRAALRAKADDDARLRAIAERLDRYAAMARCETPFGFYAHLLGAERGRAEILARLGLEAADALDEFLEHALDYETRQVPSLQGFVAWLRAGSTEVKRDMDIARDEVRVMTVHGAKGLEAPVVVLADTTTPPKGPREPRLIRLAPEAAPPGTPERLVWAGAKASDVPAVAAARETAVRAAEDEYRRLLYVAMTRAADQLIVCGARNRTPKPAGCWYDLVWDALKPEAVQGPAEDREGTVWRWRRSAMPEREASLASLVPVAPVHGVPAWLREAAPPAPPRPRNVSPSLAGEEPAWTGAPLARRRGILMHRLLQALPEIPRERRAEAAQRHLARGAPELAESERARIVDDVLAVLEDPQFAALFAPGSRAEVPIVGRIARAGTTVAVSGQVDRLAVTAQAVLIGDYKTGRIPRDLDEVAPAHVTQLALYREVLASLYPGRAVRAVLIFTDGPVALEPDSAELDAALARVTSS